MVGWRSEYRAHTNGSWQDGHQQSSPIAILVSTVGLRESLPYLDPGRHSIELRVNYISSFLKELIFWGGLGGYKFLSLASGARATLRKSIEIEVEVFLSTAYLTSERNAGLAYGVYPD